MVRATIGILSIGDMGLGIAKLLMANDYLVITNASGRSQATKDRAERNFIKLVTDDDQLCIQADYILSIVPPRDAIATAQRIVLASAHPDSSRSHPLYFLDLNAISPSSARRIEGFFADISDRVRMIDGAIIGGPPYLQSVGSWYRPSIPVSGPRSLSEAPVSGGHLSEVLNVKHINAHIGSASGLKMCFASLSKGFTALAIQSYTTAHRLGVLEELREQLTTTFPEVRQRAERGLVGMPPKAYRWVKEMEEIAETFREDGGFVPEEAIFDCIARVYELVAYQSELGKEVTESRIRGKTADDVAILVAEGTARRRAKSL